MDQDSSKNNLIAIINDIYNKYVVTALKIHDGYSKINNIEIFKNVIIINISYNQVCGSCSSIDRTTKMIENLIEEELDDMNIEHPRIFIKVENDISTNSKFVLLD